MKTPKVNKNVLLIIALVIVLAVGYFTFFRGGSKSDELVSVEANPAIPTFGQELLIELNRLKALRAVNKDIFDDPIFVSLEDFTVPVSPEPLGRSNPFAPL